MVAPGTKLGIAVSGGADSLALLLLAASAFNGLVEAATVDHCFRSESAQEAEFVRAICGQLDVPHRTLKADWVEKPRSNIQSAARERRYLLLADWANDRGIGAVATAHHADDQAETILMRLARGAGIAGLASIRPKRDLSGVGLVRPLLGWRRSELRSIVETAGLEPVDDPSNHDLRFDRSVARITLESAEWLDPLRLSAAASHARDADAALDWAAAKELEVRAHRDGNALLLSPDGLPRELKRRVLLAAINMVGGHAPSGPDLVQALERLEAGEITTLGGLKLEGGAIWRLSIAPARRV